MWRAAPCPACSVIIGSSRCCATPPSSPTGASAARDRCSPTSTVHQACSVFPGSPTSCCISRRRPTAAHATPERAGCWRRWREEKVYHSDSSTSAPAVSMAIAPGARHRRDANAAAGHHARAAPRRCRRRAAALRRTPRRTRRDPARPTASTPPSACRSIV